MAAEPLLNQFVESLRCLPGVGPKTAQRMALHLLERNREAGLKLAEVLEKAMQNIGRCKQCRDLTELDVCTICANPRRDQSLLCIVESPVDVLAIEQATAYQGRYFVLLGRLSPLDGIGPAELGLDQLAALLELGCEYGQGYLFGKAVPANEISALLQARKAIPAGKRYSPEQ